MKKRRQNILIIFPFLLVFSFETQAQNSNSTHTPKTIQDIKNQIVVELTADDPDIFKQPQSGSLLEQIFENYGYPQVIKIFSLAQENTKTHHERISKKFSQRHNRRAINREIPRLENFYKLEFSVDEHQLIKILDLLKKVPEIKSSNFESLAEVTYLPNDPYYFSSGAWNQQYDDLWGLKITSAEMAWNVTTGQQDIVVAVIDTGVDIEHEDLFSNIYTNTDEIPGNGLDDDKNGFVDDVHGFDVYDQDDDVTDYYGHGTHVSGIIAAVGNNNTGIAGMMWRASILPVKALSDGGWGAMSEVAKGIVYAADQGADVINLSLGGVDNDSTLQAAVEYAASLGVVLVAASGNNSIDATAFYPAAYNEVITVGASTPDDRVAKFSNDGPKIDVVAPGGGDSAEDQVFYASRNILSLKAFDTDLFDDNNFIIEENYYRSRGTSMAAPYVAGLAGLLLSYDETLSAEEVRQVLRFSADDIEDDGWDEKSGYGRINAGRAFQGLSSVCEALITTPLNSQNKAPRNWKIKGIVGGQDFSFYSLRLGKKETSQVTWMMSAYQNDREVTGEDLAQFPLSFMRKSAVEIERLVPSAGSHLGSGTYILELKTYDSRGIVCGEDYKVFDVVNTPQKRERARNY